MKAKFSTVIFILAFWLAGCGGSPPAQDVVEATVGQTPTTQPTAPPKALLALKPFTSKAGNFSVLLPTDPVTDRFPVIDDQTTMQGFTASQAIIDSTGNPASVEYMVSYADMPGFYFVSNQKFIERSFDNARDRALAGWNGTWLQQTPVSLGDFPGREVSFEVNIPEIPGEGEGTMRIYMVGSRLYTMLVMGPKETLPEDSVIQFLESLELLETPEYSEDNWPRYTSEGDEFAILMPARPLKTIEGGRDTFSVREQHLVYSLAYSDSPWDRIPQNPVALDQFFDRWRDQFAQLGQVTDETEMTLADEYPGQRLVIAIDNPVFPEESVSMVEIYLVGNRVYLLFVEGSEQTLAEAETRVDRFFSSFEIITPPVKPAASQPTWELFTSEAGAFEVLFPEKPLEHSVSELYPTGEVKNYLFIAQDTNKSFYRVGYFDIPEGVPYYIGDIADINRDFDESRNIMLMDIQATFVSETDISIGDYPGRHINFAISEATVPGGGQGILRMILVERRLYQLLAMGRTGDVTAESLDEFAESFVLLEETDSVSSE
ncbi:MAG: hypothetical protein AAF485_01790 [Chloroflexota bacterium]